MTMRPISSREKIRISLFCGFYIAVHLVVVSFAIRAWPFTDYPMFSLPYYADKRLFVYRYSIQMIDGSVQKLGRSFAKGYGIGEPNLTALLLENQIEEFKIVLRKWLEERPDRDQIARIRVSIVEAIRPQSSREEFQFQESEFMTFTRQDLE